MKRGTIAILIILLVAIVAAAASVVFHYRNQRRAQQFWGTTTAVLIDKAPQVEALALGEPGQDISLESADPEQPSAEKTTEDEMPNPAARKAVEFNQVPWIVLTSKDAAAAKGMANLRRALVLDTTYDWVDEPNTPEPKWQYGVSISDGKNWAAVLFDFDTRQVGLTGGRKTALLNPEANNEFRQFFAEQFSEKKNAAEQVESKPDEGKKD